MIMRSTKLLLSLSLLLPASAIQARQLTPAQALDRAVGGSGTSLSRSSSADYTLSFTASAPGSTVPGVYVFSRQGGGFVMVSADDSAEALLGYSDSSTFSADAMSPSMVYWLEAYASQVDWASSHPASPSRAASERPSRASISPLLTTTWNQDAPYNLLCPVSSNASSTDGRCPTGCVATSTSQVMNYHEWPVKGTGSKSYTFTLDKVQHTRSMDFSTVTFDWANMLDSYSGSYTEAQGNAVATLMEAVGTAVEMQYTGSESGASPLMAWEALFTYFGYSKSATFSQRSWYGLYDWEDLIYNTLKNDGPAILGGQSGTGGHSFVCDGYDKDGYFHINWGWGGTSNGYFLLTALNPTTQGIGGSQGGYNFDQNVITGIRPASGSSDDINRQLLASEINPSSSAARQVTLTDLGVYTYSSDKLTNVVLGLEIAGNYYFSNAKIPEFAFEPGAGYEVDYTVSLAGLPAGTYEARPAFKCDGLSGGKVMLTEADVEPFFTITVASDGTVTTSVPAQHISASDIKFDTSFLQGQKFSFTAEVSNSGSIEFAGAVAAILLPSGSNEATRISEYAVDLMPGESTTATFTGTIPSSLAAGSYTLYIANISADGGVETISAPESVTVSASTTPVIGLTSFSIANSEAVDPEAINVTYQLTNTGGTFIGNIEFAIFNQGESTTSNILQAPMIQVPANTTEPMEFTVTLKFPAGVAGSTYNLVPYLSNKQLGYGQTFTIAKSSGIDGISADGGSKVTAIYTVDGQLVPTLDLRDLSAGIYIVVTPEGNYKYLAR